jgi:hypothetical protein
MVHRALATLVIIGCQSEQSEVGDPDVDAS